MATVATPQGFTSWYQEHMAAIVMCDVDVRKNFEPALQQRRWVAAHEP